VAACGNQISYRESSRLGGTPEAPYSQARPKEYSNPTKCRSSQIAPGTAAKYVKSFPRKTLEAFGIHEVDAHQVGGFLTFDAPWGDLSCHYLKARPAIEILTYIARLHGKALDGRGGTIYTGTCGGRKAIRCARGSLSRPTQSSTFTFSLMTLRRPMAQCRTLGL